MLKIIKTRIQQKYRTMAYPDGPPPEIPARFSGMPVIGNSCSEGGIACKSACPTGAVAITSATKPPKIDMGSCLFCRACEKACPDEMIHFSRNYQISSTRRENLIVSYDSIQTPLVSDKAAVKLFSKSFKLRQVSAGGCNACEADSNVLGTPAWDMGRFGIQFVASPRHADALLITGPVTTNMHLALQKTYRAVPDPKIVIAVGACAISGGIYSDHPEQLNGVTTVVPVDLFIPGCPPHPLTILDGLLRFLGRVT